MERELMRKIEKTRVLARAAWWNVKAKTKWFLVDHGLIERPEVMPVFIEEVRI